MRNRRARRIRRKQKNDDGQRFVTHKGYRQVIQSLTAIPKLDLQAIAQSESGRIFRRADRVPRMLTEESSDRYRTSAVEDPRQNQRVWKQTDVPLVDRESSLACSLFCWRTTWKAVITRDYKAKASFTTSESSRAQSVSIPVDVRGSRAWSNEVRGIPQDGCTLST